MKAEDWVGRWKGRTVVCIASGPSLTPEDCERVKHLPAIVTNTTFKLCPWAEVLIGFDSAWWKKYRDEVAGFAGRKLTLSTLGERVGAESLVGQTWFVPFPNSGACAVSLAIAGGAERVLMLGYDCQKTDGKTHWHGDHPKELSNARSMPNWPLQFQRVAKYADRKGVKVLNCTRQTALTCFERAEIESVL